jgi:hypothetical protein
MALPSTRELELEVLVRQRDAQIQELSVSSALIHSLPDQCLKLGTRGHFLLL